MPASGCSAAGCIDFLAGAGVRQLRLFCVIAQVACAKDGKVYHADDIHYHLYYFGFLVIVLLVDG